MMINRLWMLTYLLLTHYAIIAQDPSRQNGDSTANIDKHLVADYTRDISFKADHLGHKLDKYTAKALRKIQKQEATIKRKLAKTDSVKATAVFGNADEQYKELEQKLQQTNSIQQYIPVFDTLNTSLKFLQQNPQLASIVNQSGKWKETVSKLNGLGGKLEKAEEIKKFLKERKQYLKEQLQHLGFAKQLKKLNKQTYYYSEQLNEYKSLLKDHKKAEKKVLALLSKTKLFQNFMRKNSMLASLFRLPGDPDDPVSPASLAGLQTRAQVNNLIQQQIGTNGQEQFQRNMQDAQSQLQKVKDKMNRFGSSSSDAEMPEGFKPNDQKTKSFLKRLELGTNIQSQKASGFFPVTSDIGISLGYKLSPRSILGIGTSYKIGWGRSIRHINVTHQGVGLRSFIDWKIKGSFWLTGGYEMNYRSEIRSIEQLKDYSAWQRSGLIGLSKKYRVSQKLKGDMQLLWDFLSYQQIPKTQAIIFRIGYKR